MSARAGSKLGARAPTRHRFGRKSARLRLRRPGPRVIIALAALVAILAGGFFWVRDSSLVAVRKVRVTGVTGPDAAQIRSALVLAARNMTTLDVNMGQLRTAVAPYPVVKRLEVSTQFPHGMRIRVIEQIPVAVVVEAGHQVAVAGDGTLLHDVVPSSPLPAISVLIPPGGPRLTGDALTEVRLLGAAPYRLLPKIGGVSDGAAHGLVAQLRDGPKLYFGTSDRLAAKWSAAVAVLADGGSAGAVYVDVTDPSRPAVGVGTDSATASSAASGG